MKWQKWMSYIAAALLFVVPLVAVVLAEQRHKQEQSRMYKNEGMQ